jgi:hypothetical protein
MTPSEWRSLAQSVNKDIAGMARAATRQDGVKAAMEQRVFRATEEYFINEDSFRTQPDKPRLFTVGAVELKVWKTHHGWRMKEDAQLAVCSLYCGTPSVRGSLHSLTRAIVQTSSVSKSLADIDT